MGFVKPLGACEDRACAVDDESAQVLISLFGNAPEEAALTGAELPRRDAEPGGVVTA